MARINIEECWWSDTRRQKLVRLFRGDARLADGLMIQAWRLAQKYAADKFLIPINEFLCLEDGEFLFECNLAEICIAGLENPRNVQANSKQCLDELGKGLIHGSKYLVYVRGSDIHLAWIAQKREVASIGGKKSAQRPRDSKGRLLSIAQVNSKQCLDESPSESNRVQRSLSSSSSSSSSSSKKIASNKFDALYYGPQIEILYEKYPKRKGHQHRQKGIETLARQIKTDLDLESLSKAVTNYARHCIDTSKVGTEYVLQFKTFASSWREWVEPPTTNVTTIHPKTQQRLDVLNTWLAKQEQGGSNGEK